MMAAAFLAVSVTTTLLSVNSLPIDHVAMLAQLNTISTSQAATMSASDTSMSAVSRSFERSSTQATAITTAANTSNDYVDAEGYKDFPEQSEQLAKKYEEQKAEKARKAKVVTTAQYTLAQFMSAGVINSGGHKFTYYSQSVLPGGGLSIPGRHVTTAGYVCDADGYIVLAGSAAIGTVYDTPFGAKGKVYDRGTTGNHLDVYVR